MNKIAFSNYKAFDHGEIELRPLTLLLGANSSGKSSIIHLLLMLEQSFCNSEHYNAALHTNGFCVNLGEDENLLKDRNHELPLQLEFSINAMEYANRTNRSLSEIKEGVSTTFFMKAKTMFPDKYKEYSEQALTLTKALVNETPALKSTLMQRLMDNDSDILYQMLVQSDMRNRFIPSWWSNINDASTLEKSVTMLNECVNTFAAASKPLPKEGKLILTLRYDESTKRLQVAESKITLNDKIVIAATTAKGRMVLTSDVFKEDTLRLLADESKLLLSFNGLSLSPKSNSHPFVQIVKALFENAFRDVSNFFSRRNVRYVGPLRAKPQRYYFLDDSYSHLTLDHKNGASLAEILKSNPMVKESINKWMEKFELSIGVEEFKDVIHNIKVTQNGLSLDIPDVGFGISQLLPILVEGLMAPPQSTFIIEQPEIHLHPKMQADLADLFIDIVKTGTEGKVSHMRNLVIETHSEYLLKRLRLRMAEGSIDPSLVAIYFIKPRNKENPDTAEVSLTEVGPDGSIAWPKDFYSTEMEDELAFLRQKISKS